MNVRQIENPSLTQQKHMFPRYLDVQYNLQKITLKLPKEDILHFA